MHMAFGAFSLPVSSQQALPISLLFQAILDWLSSVKESQIALVDKNSDFGLISKASMKITIVGYSLEALKKEKNLAEMERKFKVVVLVRADLDSCFLSSIRGLLFRTNPITSRIQRPSEPRHASGYSR